MSIQVAQMGHSVLKNDLHDRLYFKKSVPWMMWIASSPIRLVILVTNLYALLK